MYRIFYVLVLALLAHATEYEPLLPGDPFCYIADPPDPTMECTNCETKVLWVICAADSAAIAPYDSLPFGQQGSCTGLQRRATYPTTYTLPSWASTVFSSADERSVTDYFLKQSFGNKLVTGEVVADTTTGGMFLCSDTTWLVPNQCQDHSGGSEFVRDIMSQVDAQRNLADFLSDPDDVSIYVFLNIYGHAEADTTINGGDTTIYSWTSGGGWGGILGYTSPTDTNANGEYISIRGCTGWSSSIEWISLTTSSPDPIIDSYWGGLGIFAHEFGHDLGLDHTFEDDGNGSNASHHIPVGSYDIMSYSPSFWDKSGTWFRGQPGPFHALSRMNVLHWIDPIVVDRPYWDLELGDHLENEQYVKIPAYVDSGTDPYDDSDGQYFVAYSLTRETFWERWAPSDGLMIYHYNEDGDQDIRGNKRYDMELSTGLYDWTARIEFNGWETVPTGENTLVENTVTGLDSFDFLYFHNDSFEFQGEPWPIPRADYVWAGEHGFPGNYFVAGDTFNDFSNPSSKAYDNTNSTFNPQSLPTMAGIVVESVNAASHITTITAWSRHWRGTVTTDVTWLDSVVVDSSLTFASGTELTILPGTKIVVDANATITINGSLTAIGTSGSPITFKAKDAGERWNGLTINGGSVEMDYVNLQDFKDHGLYVESPVEPVSIDHVNFDCSKLKYQAIGLRLWNSPTVTQFVENTTVTNVPADSQVAGMYLYNCKVGFNGVTIEECDWINSYIKKVTGNFRSCNFRDRTGLYAVYFGSAPNTPNFRCCNFFDLSPHSGTLQSTVFCAGGTSPSFGGEGNTGGSGVSNLFTDSCAHLMTMQGSLALPVIDSDPPAPPYDGTSDGGKNDWKNRKSGGKYIEWRYPGTTTYPCTDQHWMNGIDTTKFTPTTPARWDFDPYQTSAWGTCGGGVGGGQGSSIGDDGPIARGEGGTLDDNEYDDILLDAFAFEAEEDYAAAQQLFRYVAENSPAQVQRWTAIVHVVVCEAFVGSGQGWIPDLLSTMIENEDSYEARVQGERLRASYHQNRNEYDDAIETCVELLSSGLTYEDSIYVAMDLVSLQLGAGGGGSLDGMSASQMIPAPLKARDGDHALSIERGLFEQLSPTQGESKESASVPTEFTLSQNYPNPFNPSTEIEFALPIASNAKLKVYDVTGRLVTTLVNETLTAGTHRVSFDAARLPSGVYFYNLNTGQHSLTRKMVLLR